MQVGTKLRSPIPSEPRPAALPALAGQSSTAHQIIQRQQGEKTKAAAHDGSYKQTGRKEEKQLELALQKVFNLNCKAF